jgi:putative membrane protein
MTGNIQKSTNIHSGEAAFRYRIPLKELRKFIWIFFSVGIVGMGLPWTREIFVRLVPLTFIVCLAVLAIADQTRNPRLYWVSGIIFVTGWLVEALGVNTGVLFGEYAYSLHMGPAIAGTPLVMGLSWLMMLYLTVSVVQEVTMHPYYRPVLAAVLMVVFDFLLEPAAIWMKMWYWEGGKVPIMNYIMWFLVSLVLASLFPILKIRIRNRLALRLYVAQMVFFLMIMAISFVENLIRG